MSKIKILLILLALVVFAYCEENLTISSEIKTKQSVNEDLENLTISSEIKTKQSVDEDQENLKISSEIKTNQSIDEAQSEPTDEEDKEQFASFAKKLMEEMGVGDGSKDVLIPREKFKVFLKKLITKDEKLDASEEEFYNEMVDKIVEKVPEEINSKEINKYIDQEYLMNILNDIIKEKYGEEALNDFNQGADSDQHPEL